MRLDIPADVPSPIDLRRLEDAQAWAESANVKRPWRAEFFSAFVSELVALPTAPLSIIELGSGPGFLAERIVRELPGVHYTLFDFSPSMHQLARGRLGSQPNLSFVEGDFKREGWSQDLGSFHAVVTLQSVHELRHKRYASALHLAVRELLHPRGVYLVCDHIAGPGGMTNTELYMSVTEQANALIVAGFDSVSVVLEKRGLVLHRARKAA